VRNGKQSTQLTEGAVDLLDLLRKITYARIEDAETETENAATQVHPADRGNGWPLAARAHR